MQFTKKFLDENRKKIYEGKAKYQGQDKYIDSIFQDDATAFNNKRKINSGKGVLSNFISELIMTN